MTALITYLRHVREEFKHITWPTNRQAIAHTLTILLICAIVVAIVGVLDYAFTNVVSSVVG